MDEMKVLEIFDNICKTDRQGGEWIREIDIVEGKRNNARVLELIRPGGVSKCKEECATLAKSCMDLLDEEIDRDELSSLLYKGKLSLSQLQEKICVKMSGRWID